MIPQLESLLFMNKPSNSYNFCLIILKGCELCNPCLENNEREFLKMAYMEHVHRGAYRRVYPPPMVSGVIFLSTSRIRIAVGKVAAQTHLRKKFHATFACKKL